MKINNKTIELYVSTILNKSINDITNEDLSKIEHLPIDISTIDNKKCDFSFIMMFPNLKSVSVSNGIIKDSNINILASNNSIIKYTFTKCRLENEKSIYKLDNTLSLSFIKCYMENYDFLQSFHQLKELSIIDPYNETIIDLKTIKSNNLESLSIENCVVEHFDLVRSFEKCKEMSFYNSVLEHEKVRNIEFPKSLKKVIIPQLYYYDIPLEQKENINIITNIMELMSDTDNIDIETSVGKHK